MKTLMTLCLITQNGNVLLGMKKRGFGAGWWNGFGGKTHEGEPLDDAVQRELEEETGIRAVNPVKRAVLTFAFRSDNTIINVHVYAAEQFEGTPTETEEMKPQWFSTASMPFDSMWPDDRYWMPRFFQGERLRGYFLFGKDKKIVRHEVHTIENHQPL